MTVERLIDLLKSLPQDLEVYVQDGLDPSDPGEVTTVKYVTDDNRVGKPHIQILA